MGAFEIIGGKKLKGEITPQGAKNEALQVINAVLLTEKEVIINNIPEHFIFLSLICRRHKRLQLHRWLC